MIIKFFEYIQNFLNNNIGVVTFFVSFIAVYLYIKQIKNSKRDAASLILQEIRYAEQQIRKYKDVGGYQLFDKLLPTNNWSKNVNLFVKDLKESNNIDLISDFYAKTAYIDTLIHKISDFKNEPEDFKNFQSFPPTNPEQPLPQKFENQINVIIDPMQYTQKFLKDVSYRVEFIYNTPVVEKLKKIADKKWFHFFG